MILRLKKCSGLLSNTKRLNGLERKPTLIFFNMMPEDKKRIELLSRMWHKLTHDTLCTDAEIEELENGHDDFINMKLEVKVKVII